MSKNYTICSKCIMDTTDPDIEFDENGICNHCYYYDEVLVKNLCNPEAGERELQRIVDKIRQYGSNKEYDCILGLSGGVDSSFTAYLANKLGLRPLVVHFDNGWNTEVSVRNIENIVRKLDFDLYTYVMDWEEFKDLQIAFLKASVVDIEMLTDHAIMAAMFNLGREKNIKYILSGGNTATEGIMPRQWVYAKWDIRNIKAIHGKFGKTTIKKFPVHGLFDIVMSRYVRQFKYIEVLNYTNYNKAKAMEVLREELGWEYYGGKHHESVFTRFYQAYILPKKFNIDKRKAHLSSLICSGQITRDDALREIKKPLYNEKGLSEDKEYVLKKLGLDEDEFDSIMELPVMSHYDYPNNEWIFYALQRIKRLVTRR